MADRCIADKTELHCTCSLFRHSCPSSARNHLNKAVTLDSRYNLLGITNAWPRPSVFTNDMVGVDNKPAFMNFTDLFHDPKTDADFILLASLILDNLVLLRTTVE